MAKTTSSVNYLTARRPKTGNPVVATSVDPITGVISHAIAYDSLNRIVSINYRVGVTGSASEVITFTYSNSGHVEYKGVEYKDHYINVWEGTLVPISPAELDAACAANVGAELKTIETLGLTTNNIVTMDDGYDLVVTNEGELIFTPTIS